MASTYTGLGVQLMTTGEKAGTWGTLTNTNWNISEQISGGYIVQTLNAAGTGANTTTLSVSDGSAGATLANRIIILGAESAQAITGNKIVTIIVGGYNFLFRPSICWYKSFFTSLCDSTYSRILTPVPTKKNITRVWVATKMILMNKSSVI